jgi:DNA-binding MarR family transcriptional regulator
VNSLHTEQFETLYRRLWAVLRRRETVDLSQHEAQLLHHVPPSGSGSIKLIELAQHLALPKSTASVLVKNLEQRGLLRRERNPNNERELAIALTDEGAARVAADTVLDPARLSAGLGELSKKERRNMLKALEHLVDICEAAAADRRD